MVDDFVYLKISPMNGVIRFGKKGETQPQYVGPYKISECVESVAYEMKLPIEFDLVHPVFHVSILKKFIGDLMFIMPLKTIEVDSNLSYEEVPIEILDRQVKKLRNKELASAKVSLEK